MAELIGKIMAVIFCYTLAYFIGIAIIKTGVEKGITNYCKEAKCTK